MTNVIDKIKELLAQYEAGGDPEPPVVGEGFDKYDDFNDWFRVFYMMLIEHYSRWTEYRPMTRGRGVRTIYHVLKRAGCPPDIPDDGWWAQMCADLKELAVNLGEDMSTAINLDRPTGGAGGFSMPGGG